MATLVAAHELMARRTALKRGGASKTGRSQAEPGNECVVGEWERSSGDLLQIPSVHPLGLNWLHAELIDQPLVHVL